MRRIVASGFSLIELVVTIAVVAILVAIALPSFQGSLRSNQVTSTTNELIASLSLARSEALRSPGGSVICSSSDGTACDGDWNDGWIVWVDGDGSGGNPSGASDRVVRYIQGKERLEIAATSSGGGATTPKRIAFDNRGRVDDHTRRIVVQPDPCPSGQQLVRRIDVALTGQSRFETQACT